MSNHYPVRYEWIDDEGKRQKWSTVILGKDETSALRKFLKDHPVLISAEIIK